MHFPVAVLTPLSPIAEVIRVALQPWHDFETDGIDDEFVIDVDETEALTAWLRDYPAIGATVDEIAARWTDCSKKQDGRWYRRTNPHTKWDWWRIGGAWSESLSLRDGRADHVARIADLASYPPAPAAIVADGNWIEPPDPAALKDILLGRPDEKWQARFEAILNDRKAEWITIVDCHM